MTSVPAVKADIVSTSNGGYPLNQKLYQCVKGLTGAKSCAKKNGVVIILCVWLAKWSGGDAFCHWFRDRPVAFSVEKIQNVPPEDAAPDQWQAQLLARVGGRLRVMPSRRNATGN